MAARPRARLLADAVCRSIGTARSRTTSGSRSPPPRAARAARAAGLRARRVGLPPPDADHRRPCARPQAGDRGRGRALPGAARPASRSPACSMWASAPAPSPSRSRTSTRARECSASTARKRRSRLPARTETAPGSTAGSSSCAATCVARRGRAVRARRLEPAVRRRRRTGRGSSPRSACTSRGARSSARGSPTRSRGRRDRLLAPGGWLVLEAGDGQADRLAALLADSDYDEVAITRDLAGRERVVEGRRP